MAGVIGFVFSTRSERCEGGEVEIGFVFSDRITGSIWILIGFSVCEFLGIGFVFSFLFILVAPF